MWDMKPDAPAEYRGPFQPIETSAAGVRLCEHLPLLAKQSHHLALVNSVGGTVSTNDHHAGYYYNLTGHVPDPTFLSQGNNRTPYPDDWPSMGAVVGAHLTRSAASASGARRRSRGRGSSRRGWGWSSTRCMSKGTRSNR